MWISNPRGVQRAMSVKVPPVSMPIRVAMEPRDASVSADFFQAVPTITDVMTIPLGCLGAFLLGAIPFALVLVRLLAGVDLRDVGSGNLGATNASRAFGPWTGLAVFVLIYLLDAGKGYVSAQLGPALIGVEDAGSPANVLMGASAVLGHCYSPFLGFRGGKGVATATGVFISLDWVALLIAIAAFLLVRLLSGQVFLGSLALGLALATAVFLRGPATAFTERLPVMILAILVALFFFYTHRSNIRGFRSPTRASS